MIEDASRGATKVAGTLRRAVRSSAFIAILGVRHMECAYYFDFCRLCQVAERLAHGDFLLKKPLSKKRQVYPS